MIRRFVIGLGGVILAGAGFAQDLPAGDADAGRKVAGQCRTCHGLDGFAQIPIAPHIGGEPQGYLERQLLAFRSGERQHEMMSVVAASLTDQMIADVTAWYAAHPVEVTLPNGVTEDAAPDACVSCHGADGIAVVEDVPNLAAETNIYIETQLKAFRLGKRTNETMNPIAAELSDEEMREIADWYAAITLEVGEVP